MRLGPRRRGQSCSRRTILLRPTRRTAWTILAIAVSAALAGYTYAQQQPEPRGKTSYMPVDIVEPFASIMARMVAAKPQIEKEHSDLLGQRYDLADRPAQGIAMSRGKPVQGGVRVKLPPGTSWDDLAALGADQV